MLIKANAPATTMGDGGQTNTLYYTPAAVDSDPAHPANLLASIADYLLLGTFGFTSAASSRTTVCVAQQIAIDVVLRQLGHECRAWLAPAGSMEARMIESAYRLTPGALIQVGVGECRHVEFPEEDRRRAQPTPPPLTGTEEFAALTLRIRLREFSVHARRYWYSTLRLFTLADVIAPRVPFMSWQAVAKEMGVIA